MAGKIAAGRDAAEHKAPAALGTVGLVITSTAIAMSVSDPPPGLDDKNLYLLTVSVAFFAGVAVLSAAVSALAADPRDPRGHRATSWRRSFMYAAAAPLAVAAGLSMAFL